MATSDKVTEALDRLTAAVEGLASGEEWRRMLEVAARFHDYSPSNVLLILAQAPWATRVAGYRKWQELNRQVRKGEKGIAVLAPCRYRVKPADADVEDADRGEAVRGFRVVHLFDVSQTDGEPLPCLSAPLLEGDAPATLWDRLAEQVAGAGFQLERGDCGGANGRTDFGARQVGVRADVEGAQAAKTLAHELGHVLLHGGAEYGRGCRGRAEVEAESVAYLVCAGAGMATDAYSFPYVTMWSGGEPEVVRETAGRVVTAARAVLAGLGLTK